MTLVSLFLISLLLLAGIQDIITPYLTEGLSAKEFSENYSTPQYIQIHRIIQFLSQVFIFLVPALVFAYLAFPKPIQYLKIKNPLSSKHILFGAFIMICSIPLINLMEHFSSMIPWGAEILAIEAAQEEMVDAYLKTTSAGTIIFNFAIFSIMAAISEEFLFRGVLQNILISTSFKKNPWIAILVTAIIFSMIHFSATGFISRFYAGILLGAAYYLSNNLIVPIVMHAINNGLVLAAYYISKANYDNPIGELDYKDLLEIVPLTIISLFLLYKFYQNRNEYTIDQVPIDPDETNFLANF